MQDQLTWAAQYEDGTTKFQVDITNGDKFAYENIDRDNLKAFTLLKGNLPVFRLIFDGDGQKLVWRRRVEKNSNGETVIAHIVGKKGRFICTVNQDGQAAVANNFKEGDRWLYPPQFKEFEVE